VEVLPGDVPQDALRVELYTEPVAGGMPEIEAMTAEKAGGAAGVLLYAADVPATRPAGDYTPRALPRRPPALLPLESTQILWRS
jgi:starch phosphorylase